MSRTITLIPGDGIGPEVTRAVVKVLEAAGFAPQWETFSAGAEAVEKHGTTLPNALLESIKKNRIALKGPITTPVGKGFTSVNVGLRKALDLYANLRPVWNLPAVKSRFSGVDLVIVRENTEDLYAGLEHIVVPAANLGADGVGVFEAVHGTAPDIAGRDIANPTALLQSAVLMLQHLGEDAKADAIVAALKRTLESGHVTPDLGGTATTTSFADAICRELKSR